MLLALRLPGAPRRGLLLGDSDHPSAAVPALSSRRLEKRASNRFLALSLLEVNHGNPLVLGKAVNRLHVGLADLAERRGGRDAESPLPAQERTDLPDRLELGDVRLQEDPIERPAGERDVIVQ